MTINHMLKFETIKPPYASANILKNPQRACEPLQGAPLGLLVRRSECGGDFRAMPFLASNATDKVLRCDDECQLRRDGLHTHLVRHNEGKRLGHWFQSSALCETLFRLPSQLAGTH